MLAFEQVHLSRKNLTHCRTCLSVQVDVLIGRKTCQENCRRLCNWIDATVNTCQRKLVHSFTPANKCCQGKTCQLVKENLSLINMSKCQWHLSVCNQIYECTTWTVLICTPRQVHPLIAKTLLEIIIPCHKSEFIFSLCGKGAAVISLYQSRFDTRSFVKVNLTIYWHVSNVAANVLVNV